MSKLYTKPLRPFRHHLYKFLLCSRNLLINVIRIALRILTALIFFAFLTIVLYGLRTRIELSTFHRWTASGQYWFSFRKRTFVTLATLHGGNPGWVEAVCSSLLATCGYYSSWSYAWLLLMPWLVKVAAYWVLRVISFGETYAMVAQADDSGPVYAFMVFINVLHVLVLIEMVLLTWKRMQRMRAVEQEAAEFRCWKQELGRLLVEETVSKTKQRDVRDEFCSQIK